jgi:hypothetical protein
MKFKKSLVLLLFLMLTSCSSIPKQEFGNYLDNFNYVNKTTQEIILVMKLIAESESQGTQEDELILEEKLNALDARLAAMDLIDKYNNVLVELASGTDPEAIGGSLQNISDGLSYFGTNNLTSLLSNVAPYGEIFSQAVALIDNAIKENKFKEAVDAAQKPIQAIIDILLQDADDLFEIQAQTLGDKEDSYRNRINNLRFDFQDFVNTLENDDKVKSSIDDFNKVIRTMKTSNDKPTDPIIYSPLNAQSPNSNDYNMLKIISLQIEGNIIEFNKIVAQINAVEEVKISYKEALKATSDAFKNLNFSIQNNQRVMPIDFAIYALNLSKAYLKLQEAK